MYKKFVMGIIAIATIIGLGIGVSQETKSASDVTLSNVEALAGDEQECDFYGPLYNGKCLCLNKIACP